MSPKRGVPNLSMLNSHSLMLNYLCCLQGIETTFVPRKGSQWESIDYSGFWIGSSVLLEWTFI